ncbi:hypothetical protein G5C51_18965 [Streptomyces sp. A7024]|uniref:Uncharacterized protein n=1 Tax=Streptomyces coryli TaxID=1128680 RepID=A0A6G4U2N0_9ACTN|nr:hypothetical protein [Streptomyces coryli]
MTVGSGGDVTFTAGQLRLELKTAPAEGDATTSRLTCAPAEGARTRLATVPVEETGRDGSSPPSSESGEPKADGDGSGDGGSIDTGAQPLASVRKCPEEPPKGKLDSKRLPKPPAGAEIEEGDGSAYCAVPVGFSTIRKQNASAIVNDPRGRNRVGMMNLAFDKRVVKADGYTERDMLGIMSLADTRSTFLSFGFQPTSAMVSFEADPATIVFTTRAGKTSTSVGYWQHLRVYDVTVNGARLDVGSKCRTSKKIDTRLTAGSDYNPVDGGVMTGSIDIPKFSGCGSGGEDLDPLINATIAGPGNKLKIRQGGVCGPGQVCEIPKLPAL